MTSLVPLPSEGWAGSVVFLTSRSSWDGAELTARAPTGKLVKSLCHVTLVDCCVFQMKVTNTLSSLDSAQDFLTTRISSVIVEVSFLFKKYIWPWGRGRKKKKS